MEIEKHQFLLTDHGELSKNAYRIPKIREYMENLPKTKVTFRLNDIPDIYAHLITDEMMEFCGSWRVPDYYDLGEKERVFVNPHSYHSNTYTDGIAHCRCRAAISKGYDVSDLNVQGEHSHSDDCKAWWRLEARAELGKRHDKIIRRVGKLGWRGPEIANRLGMSSNNVGSIAHKNNYKLGDLRDEYRRLVGNTYAYLVWIKRESIDLLSDVYAHDEKTLSKWGSEYSDYETERLEKKHVRAADGTFKSTYVVIEGD